MNDLTRRDNPDQPDGVTRRIDPRQHGAPQHGVPQRPNPAQPDGVTQRIDPRQHGVPQRGPQPDGVTQRIDPRQHGVPQRGAAPPPEGATQYIDQRRRAAPPRSRIREATQGITQRLGIRRKQRPESRPAIDPYAELASATAAAVPGAVDELHVAAALESRGVTDQSAQSLYGHRDVFGVAKVVLGRIEGRPEELLVEKPRRPRETLRTVLHGPLYLLPSAAYPAVFAYLGATTILFGMIATTAFGWVWGMAMSAIASQLGGQRRERIAGKLMMILGAAGLGIVLLGGTAIVLTGSMNGSSLVVFMVGQMAFQVTSGILVFYEKELWLALAMIPVCAIGFTHIALGFPTGLVFPTLIAAGDSVVLLLTASFVAIRMHVKSVKPDPKGRVPWRLIVKPVVLSCCFAGLSALFLLFTDTRFVIGQFDLAISVAPLVAAMGVVEWRANRFTELSAGLLQRTGSPSTFRHQARRLALRELLLCQIVLSGLGAILLAVLHAYGVLSQPGVLLVEAHVILGSAFFLGFVLSRLEQLPALIGLMSLVVGADLVAVLFFSSYIGSYAAITAFLVASISLLVLLLGRLLVAVGRVYHYR
jgi:hypothetical protein